MASAAVAPRIHAVGQPSFAHVIHLLQMIKDGDPCLLGSAFPLFPVAVTGSLAQVVVMVPG